MYIYINIYLDIYVCKLVFIQLERKFFCFSARFYAMFQLSPPRESERVI